MISPIAGVTTARATICLPPLSSATRGLESEPFVIALESSSGPVFQVACTPAQASTGQIIGWTITYSGTAQLVQHYTGVVEGGRPLLVEPTLGE